MVGGIGLDSGSHLAHRFTRRFASSVECLREALARLAASGTACRASTWPANGNRVWIVAGTLLLVSAVRSPAAEHQGTVLARELAIPGATVKATQGEQELLTWTDEAGGYRFEDLAPGTWVIEVEMFGFEASRREIEIGAEATPVAWNLAVAKPPVQQPRQPSMRERRERLQRLMASRGQQAQVMQDLTAMPATTAIGNGSQDATQSFLVTGSLSRGLQSPQGSNDPFGMRSLLGAAGAGGQGNPFGASGGAPQPGGGGGVVGTGWCGRTRRAFRRWPGRKTRGWTRWSARRRPRRRSPRGAWAPAVRMVLVARAVAR